jgi:hypothetical protein
MPRSLTELRRTLTGWDAHCRHIRCCRSDCSAAVRGAGKTDPAEPVFERLSRLLECAAFNPVRPATRADCGPCSAVMMSKFSAGRNIRPIRGVVSRQSDGGGSDIVRSCAECGLWCRTPGIDTRLPGGCESTDLAFCSIFFFRVKEFAACWCVNYLCDVVDCDRVSSREPEARTRDPVKREATQHRGGNIHHKEEKPHDVTSKKPLPHVLRRA